MVGPVCAGCVEGANSRSPKTWSELPPQQKEKKKKMCTYMKPDQWDAALPGCCCFLSPVSPNETGKDSLITPLFPFWGPVSENKKR